MTPKIISAINAGYMKKLKMKDQEMWMMGAYVQMAVGVAVDHSLNGKKANSKYAEEPIFSEMFEPLTEEERYERELKKALIAEEQWIANDKTRGLPQLVLDD